VATLRAHGFSPERAAAALGIPRASIYRLMDRSPRVRKASELSAAEIQAASAATGGDEPAMAARLEVSVRALRRRMGELALRT
jgi:two-component system, NtrC family, nitrogen regulation response regulator GlnG